MNGYLEVSTEIGRAPSDFTRAQMVRAFQRYSGGDVPEASANSFIRLRDKGWRYEGDFHVMAVTVTKVTQGDTQGGRRTNIAACQDQSALRVVDQQGKPVAAEQSKISTFLLRQYTVLKAKSTSAWKVFGFETVKGECG